jgi:hypothetical protein
MVDRVLLVSLVGCGIFGTLLFLETNSSKLEPQAAGRVSAPAEMAPVARQYEVPIDELVATALELPLFSATRQPLERSKADRQVRQEMPDVRLTGILIEPARRFAIFAVPKSKPLFRSEGEMVEAWRLDSIAPRQVSLSGPGGTATLEPRTDPTISRNAAPAPQPAMPGRLSATVTAKPESQQSAVPPARASGPFPGPARGQVPVRSQQ